MIFDPASMTIGAVSGVAFGALGVAAYLLPKLARARTDPDTMARTFDALAAESMRKSQDQFLVLATEKLKQAGLESGHDLELRQQAVQGMVEPIGLSLKEMDRKIAALGEAGAGLQAQLRSFAEDQRHLRDHTQKLATAMKNPVVRGRWGEMQLQRALEFVGMTEDVHYTTQGSVSTEGGEQRPDFVIRLPNGVQIVIDVKTPLDPYWALVEDTDDAAQEKNLTTFRASVRNHVKTLSTKNYAKQFNSPEFTVMFLPSEGLYSTAIGNDPALLEQASKANIVLASPTTVMGLLRVVMYGWQQQKMAEEARTISKQAEELYSRLATFGDSMAKLGRGLDSAVKNFNASVGSLESRVLPAMRKLKDLHVPTNGKDVPEITGIDQATRVLSAPELTENIAVLPLKASNE